MTDTYDSIVVGTGQAGPSLAVRLARSGRRVAIVERDRFGGTCVNTGCIPTKTLIASARAAHIARRGADFGVSTGVPVRVDMPRVKARKDAVVEAAAEGVESWLRGTSGLAVIDGHARFESSHTLRVGEQLLNAPEIFLNVGARARVPDLPGLDRVDYLTNSSMMEIDRLPEHLVIVGGSYVGLEFAQMMRRFGGEVTVVEMGPRLASREDDDTSAAIKEILEGEGIHIRLNARCITLAPHPAGVSVGLHCDDEARQVTGSHVLLAVGRQPNTDDLGLEEAGVETDERGYINVDDELLTSVEGIWALGDVNGRGAFTHTSYNDFEIVAGNLLDGEKRRVTDRIQAYALFIDPPLGRAGMSEREVRDSGRRALIATLPMSRVGRARERSETLGFMKVLVDAQNKQILGASILGIEGDEVIHSIVDVMTAGAPCTVLRRAMHIHPTVSEFIPTLLGELKPLG